MTRAGKLVVLLLGLLLSFKFTSVAFSSYQMVDKPESSVERIDIRGNQRIDAEMIWSHIHLQRGNPYDKTQVRSDIEELYKTGYFEYIQVDDKKGETGKVVTFIIKEKPVIVSVEYIGNKSFNESDVLRAYRNGRGPYPVVDAWFDRQMIIIAERTLKEVMAQHGNPKGTVHTEIGTIPPGSVRIRFVINEN